MILWFLTRKIDVLYFPQATRWQLQPSQDLLRNACTHPYQAGIAVVTLLIFLFSMLLSHILKIKSSDCLEIVFHLEVTENSCLFL